MRRRNPAIKSSAERTTRQGALAASFAAAALVGAGTLAPSSASASESHDDYYTPIEMGLNRDQVRVIWDHAQTVQDACSLGGILEGVLPVPTMQGVAANLALEACDRAAESQQSRIAQAYYNGTGAMCNYYIHGGIMSLNHYHC